MQRPNPQECQVKYFCWNIHSISSQHILDMMQTCDPLKTNDNTSKKDPKKTHVFWLASHQPTHQGHPRHRILWYALQGPWVCREKWKIREQPMLWRSLQNLKPFRELRFFFSKCLPMFALPGISWSFGLAKISGGNSTLGSGTRSY